MNEVKDGSCRSTLLIIEDEPDLCATFCRYFKHLKYNVLTAHDGCKGVELFGQAHPDLVLTDLRLPGMDGLQVLARIRQESRDTPVIIVSGKGEIDDVIEALRMGAWNYLSKPLESLLVLGHAVERALEHARLIQEHREALEHKLERLSLYDTLTGLPNRVFFLDRLAHELAIARRNKQQFALMIIDLDRFKWVNDTLGHIVGDDLLRVMSSRLRQCVRDSDRIARLGGDEFTIILDNVIHPENVASLAQKLIGVIREPVVLQGQPLHMGASVGIATFPSDAMDLEDLIKHAEMAMYQAKETGRNTFCFASQELHAKAAERIALENELYQALDRQELTAFYQPKLDLDRTRLCGAEALVRWIKPDGSVITPARFVPLAEETGLILPIGKSMLLAACHATAHWLADWDLPFKMAVNLSSREFQQPGLVERIREVLQESGVAAEHIEIEITESMVMGHVEKAVEVMKAIRDLGITLAMDDFGTGYSSLGYLKRFPLNTLKIDQSFVRDLSGELRDGAIVDAILAMAHSLQLSVVAEGVETVEQFTYLCSRGCEMAQGYLIGRPMSQEQFGRLITEKWEPKIPGCKK
ncbi:MAG: EAL domain-containing protein [Magnetococcales bacterium]|nr:EAL domain-containing protein [Magnetococcales bacterium]